MPRQIIGAVVVVVRYRTRLPDGLNTHRLVLEAGKRGIMIMLDQHRLDPARGISDLWCVSVYIYEQHFRHRLGGP
jgi:hypothetical protein